MGKFIDLTGQRFSRLVVIKRGPNKGLNIRWLCQCDCGNKKLIWGVALREELTTSCGCYARSLVTTHGKSDTKEFNAWDDMRIRCRNPKHKHFHRYGGRGIKVCPEWDSNFSQFLADMGEAPKGYFLDRIDNDKGYYKENCRWVSAKVSANNRSTTRMLLYKGVSKPFKFLCEEFKVDYELVRGRLRAGWDVARAIETPLTKHKSHLKNLK